MLSTHDFCNELKAESNSSGFSNLIKTFMTDLKNLKNIAELDA